MYKLCVNYAYIQSITVNESETTFGKSATPRDEVCSRGFIMGLWVGSAVRRLPSIA